MFVVLIYVNVYFKDKYYYFSTTVNTLHTYLLYILDLLIKRRVQFTHYLHLLAQYNVEL